MPDETIIGWIPPGVQYFPGESRKIVDFSESSEIFSQEAGHSPILRYDWRRRKHGADDDQNKEPTMTTATEYALDRLTRVLGFTTEEAIEIIARRQAADDRVKAEIKAERIERAARIRIEQRGSKEALVLTEGIIRRAFYDAAECFARGDSEGVKEHQDRAEFNARIHKAIERIAA